MTLAQRLTSLIQAIAQDIKSLGSRLSAVESAASKSTGGVPTVASEDFVINENQQAVFMKRIKLEDGARLKAYGILVEPR